MNPQIPATPSASGSTGTASPPDHFGKLTQAKEAIAQTARDAAAKLRSAAGDATSVAREEASRLAAEKKAAAAARVGGYSAALHESARSLEEQDPNIAYFTHRAADKLQGVADYLRARDFGMLREDCGHFARRHPAVFYGGLFFAGLLAGNLLKATAHPRSDSSPYDDDDWRDRVADPEDPRMFDELPAPASAPPPPSP